MRKKQFTESETTVDPFYKDIAKKLLSILRDNGMVRSINTKVATECVRKMVEVDKVSKKRIGPIISWLEDHIKDKTTPYIYNGKMFRERFESLEDSMKKYGPSKITPLAKTIAERLRRRALPAGMDSELTELVQKSLDSYGVWFDTFNKWVTSVRESLTTLPVHKLSIEDRQSFKSLRLAQHLRITVLAKPEHFIEQIWLPNVIDRVEGWSDFKGSLLRYVFRPDSTIFLKVCRSRAYYYMGESILLDRILKGVARCMNKVT